MSVRRMLLAARLLALAAALVLLGGAVNWFMHRAWFDFKRIELRGDLTHVSAASVRAAIAGHVTGNFFTVRLDDVRRAPPENRSPGSHWSARVLARCWH